MTTTAPRSIDYRELMRKVERLVEAMERADDVEDTVRIVAEEIIAHFRDELGVYGGRLYRRVEDEYVLRNTFGSAKPLEPGLRLPSTYPPIAACLDHGVVFVHPGDPGVDAALEEGLGVEEFTCIAVGNSAYILAFNVIPGAAREDMLFSLQILRHTIDQKVRQERMAEVFREARLIQGSIVPARPPVFPPYDVVGRIEPMESVGGDFYDLIPISEKVLGVAMADVSGHGLPAALQVRDVHMGLRMGMARDFKILRTVERLNEIIHQSTLTSKFVALFYGELEPNGNFIYVNAGHVAPFHLRADGEARFLTQGGAVLGPLARATYERGFVSLQQGDLVVMFTDGIVEAVRPGTETELGVGGLLEVVRARRTEPASAIVDAVFDAVAEHTGGNPPEDDRTVIVIRHPQPPT